MKFRHINTIAQKEFQSYLNSPLGYLFLAAFLVTTSFWLFKDFFLIGISTLRPFFEALPWVYLVLIPAITMPLWAEERKLGTIELLFTSPLTPAETVLGKFLACMELLTLGLVLSGLLPFLLFFIGQPDWGAVLGGYLGALLLGASTVAVGFFISSLTDNQIVAFIVSAFLIALLALLGQDFFLRTLPEVVVPVVRYLSSDFHYQSLLRGMLDTRDLVYYFSFLFFFYFLTVTSLHYRKWK